MYILIILLIGYFIGFFFGHYVYKWFGTSLNFHDFSLDIAEYEGKKKSVDIAQIKEILHIVLSILNKYPDSTIISTVRRIK